MALWFRVSFHGRENLPSGGGYILTCNHNSNADPMIITWPIWTMVCYMAKEQLFNPLYGWFFLGVGAFPVKRGTGDTAAIDTAAQRLRNGKILGMFPEGHRNPFGEPGRAKSGVALVAKATGANVVPCAIYYSKGIKFGTRVSVYYGKPITNEELFAGEEGPRQIKQATKKIWSETLTLLEVNHGVGSGNS